MIDRAIALALVIAGAIHLMPLPGVLGAAWLARLYAVDAGDAGLVLLLRHRAVLFGLLGALLVGAAWLPQWRALAIGAGLVSTVAFLALSGDPRALSAALVKVWRADVAALACLIAAALLEWSARIR